MQKNPDFNHHAKCKKLCITNLAFADDVLLFVRGDTKFVEMMMEAMSTFYKSTGLVVNPKKGSLPFKYLGVPLTSKHLSMQYYMPLVDRIVGRIHQWITKLLSYAGRIQLIKIVYCDIALYWMHSLPLPKCDIHIIEVVCRTFLWTGGSDVSRKSLLAWKNVCNPMEDCIFLTSALGIKSPC